MFQHPEATFPVMVSCNGGFEPVVFAIDEDYDQLLNDFQQMFGNAKVTESTERKGMNLFSRPSLLAHCINSVLVYLTQTIATTCSHGGWIRRERFLYLHKQASLGVEASISTFPPPGAQRPIRKSISRAKGRL